MEYIKLLDQVGFPIAAALSAGAFVFITVKFILSNVSEDVKGVIDILEGLDKRVNYMTNEIRRIDIKVSIQLGVKPDCSLVSRTKSIDVRKD